MPQGSGQTGELSKVLKPYAASDLDLTNPLYSVIGAPGRAHTREGGFLAFAPGSFPGRAVDANGSNRRLTPIAWRPLERSGSRGATATQVTFPESGKHPLEGVCASGGDLPTVARSAFRHPIELQP